MEKVFRAPRTATSAVKEMFFRRRRNRRACSNLTRGKKVARSAARDGNHRHRRREARVRPLTAEQRQHVEQTWAYRFSRDGYPHSVNERSGLHTTLVGDATQCGFERR